MNVTREQLAKALEGFDVWVKPEAGQDPSVTFAGKVVNAGAAANRLFDRIAGSGGDTARTGNREEAGQALSASTWQQQKWGESGSKDELRSARLEAERAKVHALLDVADAIREQTVSLTGDDKRAILIERNQ